MSFFKNKKIIEKIKSLNIFNLRARSGILFNKESKADYNDNSDDSPKKNDYNRIIRYAGLIISVFCLFFAISFVYDNYWAGVVGDSVTAEDSEKDRNNLFWGQIASYKIVPGSSGESSSADDNSNTASMGQSALSTSQDASSKASLSSTSDKSSAVQNYKFIRPDIIYPDNHNSSSSDSDSSSSDGQSSDIDGSSSNDREDGFTKFESIVAFAEWFDYEYLLYPDSYPENFSIYQINYYPTHNSYCYLFKSSEGTAEIELKSVLVWNLPLPANIKVNDVLGEQPYRNENSGGYSEAKNITLDGIEYFVKNIVSGSGAQTYIYYINNDGYLVEYYFKSSGSALPDIAVTNEIVLKKFSR